jgi:uncharacterized damage-inducible protein DinB
MAPEDPILTRPDASEYAAPFAGYVQKTPAGDIREHLTEQLSATQSLLRGLSEAESLARHAPYTWSVKQVIGHITDCERVFGHRVLGIARGGGAPLPSFDETVFMEAADFDRWPFADLLAEFDVVRRSHLALLRHLESAAWTRHGIVLDHPTTVRAMAHVMFGHAQHHLNILHQRLAR